MKVVINKCYGGFSLSALAVKRLAELNGKPAYFFIATARGDLRPATVEECTGYLGLFVAFTTPNPPSGPVGHEWVAMSMEERMASNEAYKAVALDPRPEDRADPLLVQVVEELGEKANGKCAELRIVEIPDGVGWEIDEYDGIETVHEKHRSWC